MASGQTDTTAQSGSATDAAYDPAATPAHGASEMSLALQELRDLLLQVLPGARASEHRGELTVDIAPEGLLDALRTCKDDQRIACELLSDLSAVHRPGGVVEENDQETTGWPTFTEVVEEGSIELLYVLRSISHNRWFRLRTAVPDEPGSAIASATPAYSSANVMEREVYDMMGVVFDGHPNLTRVLMPEDWEGHPHRKDYPLGGVEVMYHGTTVPPPDERDY